MTPKQTESDAPQLTADLLHIKSGWARQPDFPGPEGRRAEGLANGATSFNPRAAAQTLLLNLTLALLPAPPMGRSLVGADQAPRRMTMKSIYPLLIPLLGALFTVGLPHRASGQTTPPAITAQPENQAVGAGSNATFSVTATGTAPLSYQWRSNAVSIAGATNVSLTLSNCQASWTGSGYSVVVANAFGSVTSSVAGLTVSSRWTATGPLATGRSGHTATLLPNGKVLVAGGIGSTGFVASAEVCDPAQGTWTATGPLATGRSDHTATLLPNGKVLVTGGVNNSGILASAEVYDPAQGTWTATGSLAIGRS
ncbi:MAG: hypothetical protein EBU23_15175, partial [Mycobacteriaceae bacterium]|nr:hypothetical protein [Mycobacteriaceae bacterium]